LLVIITDNNMSVDIEPLFYCSICVDCWRHLVLVATSGDTGSAVAHSFATLSGRSHLCYSAPVGEQIIVISLSVCLSASISLEPLDRYSQIF